MTTGALLFMVASWAFVLVLTFWSFYRILSIQREKAERVAAPSERKAESAPV